MEICTSKVHVFVHGEALGCLRVNFSFFYLFSFYCRMSMVFHNVVYISTSIDCGIEVIFHTVLQTESVVNSGPAIFISPTGPNPMMVQVSPETVNFSTTCIFLWSNLFRCDESLQVYKGNAIVIQGIFTNTQYHHTCREQMLLLFDKCLIFQASIAETL